MTRFGGAAKVDTRPNTRWTQAETWRRRTPGKQMAGTCWTKFGGAAKADSRQTQGGHMSAHMADRRRAHGSRKADTWRTKGKADTWQTRFGGAAKVDKRGGHMADKVWRSCHRGLKADTGHMAGTWRTRFGGAAKADSRRHKADKLRGRGQSILSRSALIFPRENPTLNCLGNNP